jgi:autotransporter-associated beta strand protein
VSFDDSVTGRSGTANTGTVLLDTLTYQGSVATSNLNLKNGALVVSGNATLGGFESAAGTTLTVNNTASTSTLSVDIASGTTQTVAGVLNGSGAFSKAGAGTLVFTGGSAYTGGITIGAGTVQVGNGSTAGNLGTGTITNNGTLIFKRSDNIGVADVITGTGVLRQEGTGQLTLSATNTYTGSTTVNAGTLGLSSDSNLGAAPSTAQADQLVVNNGAGLYFYPVFVSMRSAMLFRAQAL